MDIDYSVLYTRKGQKILIDPEDYERVSFYTWCLDKNGYPVTNFKKGEQVYLHNMIMGPAPEAGLTVDHIDRNSKNCRKGNLRWATQSLQNINQRIRDDNTSGTKGVDFHARYGWRARIQFNYKCVHLGWFEDKESAVAARKAAEKTMFAGAK